LDATFSSIKKKRDGSEQFLACVLASALPKLMIVAPWAILPGCSKNFFRD